MTSKRQVTFPAEVLAALGAGPGSHLELQPRGDGFILKARGIDHAKLAPLRGASVLTALQTEEGFGLVDRLIADDYKAAGMKVLTRERKMSQLAEAEKL